MNIYKPMFLGPDLHSSALAGGRPDFKTLAKAGSKAGLADFKIFKQKPARVGGLSGFKYLIYIYADNLSDLESFEISGRALREKPRTGFGLHKIGSPIQAKSVSSLRHSQ